LTLILWNVLAREESIRQFKFRGRIAGFRA
jgi:hypothetical protein